MATTSNKRSELVIVCNTKQATDMLKQWEAELKKAKTEMKTLADAGKTGTAEFQRLDATVKNLSKSISINKTNMERVDNVMKNLSTSSMRQLRLAARDVKKEMEKMSASDPKLKQMQENLRKLNDQMRKLKGETASAGNSMASAWRKTAMAVSSYLGVTMLLGKVKQMMTDVISLNLKYSDQLADIRKVSGLTARDIDKLSVNLSKIDTRTSLQEMAQIAYSGAKLGMGKYGIEGLESFVNAANQVNVALKEDLGQDALTALSKMVEVMGLIPKMGVEQSLLATGSAMFKLASTSTADAGSIVEFSKRLTGMARAAGITTDQLLALGSASSSMALMPEVSATAFSKLITSLQTSHNLIEDALHIDKGTISNLFESGKLIDAIVMVFEKMHEMGNMNAIDPIFKDLGSDGARLKTVMVTMSQNVDMLKEHIQTSAEAFKDATAVTAEYNIQQETAEALMERASHTWEKAFVNPEGVDMVKSMAQAWYNFSKATVESSGKMFLLKSAFTMLVGTIKVLLNLLPALLMALMMRGAYGAIMMVVNGVKALVAAQFFQKLATEGLIAAWRTLNAVQKANMFTALIAVAAELVVVFSSLIGKTKDATGYMEGFDRSLGGVRSRIAEVQSEALRYKKAIDKANIGTKERAAAIKNFNDKFGKYYSNLLTEKSTALDIAKAYKEVCKQLERKAVLEMKEDDIKKHYTPRVGWAAQRLYDYGEIAQGAGLQQYNSTWLKGVIDDKHSTKSVVASVAKTLGLNQKDIETALAHANDTSIPTQILESVQTVGTSSAGITMSHSNYRQLNARQRMLIAAARSAAQSYSAQNSLNKIDEKYKPWEDMLLSEPEETEDHDELENEKPDEEAIKEAKRQEAERKRAMREELKQAQDEARAVMDNIKNFYQRQITEVLKTANEQQWDEQLLQSATDAITARQNLALSQARKGIAGIKTNWEEFKKTMKDDMVEVADEVGYNESQQLLDLITTNNLAALHKKINGLADNLGLPANAATDAIWKNASLNEKSNETAEQRRLRERQKKLLEDNYTAKVDNQYANSMTQLGYFDVNDAQSQTLLAAAKSPDGMATAQALLARRAEDIEKVFRTTREHIVELVNIDNVTTPEGKDSLMRLLFGEDWQNSPTELKELLALEGEELQLFYNELLKYSDDYTEAQKKAHDRQKKLLDFQWERNAVYVENQHQQNRLSQASTGVMQHDATPEPGDENLPYKDMYGTKAFMSSMGDDPEVLAYQLKMEAAAAYYDFLKAHGADAETLRSAEQGILQAEMDYAKAVASQMKERLDDVYALAAPVEEFGTAMGEAFATMTEDAKAGRAAVKEAIGDMINGFLKQTITMTQEHIKRRIMQEANDRLTSEAMRRAAKEQEEIEDEKNDELKKTQSKGQKSIIKSITGWLGDRLKIFKKKKKEETKVEQQGQKETENVIEVGEEAKSTLKLDAEAEMTEGLTDVKNQALQVQQQQTQTEVQTESAKTQADTTLGITSGASKIIGSLGWWGIPLVAVITALLNGLLSFAMSKVSSLFGGSSSSDEGGTTKLVTGMLTYDSGNVQAFRGVQDGKSYPVVGNDGQVYAAKDGGELSTGLVKDPITTLINGQPALVAERGPEMVIGRETTAAMMMARPDILAEIVKFDRNRSGQTYRAYDEGNVADFNVNMDGGASAETLANLRTTIESLSTVLTSLQQNGIQAHIAKYGKGSVTEAAKSGSDFMRKNSGDRLWNR